LFGFLKAGEMERNFLGGPAEMRIEHNRFTSFVRTDLVKDHQRFKKFAEAGFWASDGEIICFCCRLKLSSNKYNANDILEHHKWLAPACLFVKGGADNVPMSEEVSFFPVIECCFEDV
jgi:hypothetical protein